MPVYQPNQREYYPGPGILKGYQMLNEIMGGAPDVDENYLEDAYRSEENLKAFLHSSLPYKADKEKDLKEIINLLPGLKVDPKQKTARRQLSAQAREVISDVAARRYFASNNFSKDRELRVLMSYDTSEYGRKHNEAIFQIVMNGTPEERGRLVEARVNEAMELFEKFIKGEPSNEELVENFEKIYALQELMVSAQMIGDNANRDNVARPVTLSEDVVQKLKLLELHSGEAELVVQRVKMIANANYEHLNLEYFYTCDSRSCEKLTEYLGSELDEDAMLALNRSLNLREIEFPVTWMRGQCGLKRQARLMEAVANDFGDHKEQAILKFVNNDGKIMQTNFTLSRKHTDAVVTNKLSKGGVLVTGPDGQVACYQTNMLGQVTKTTAQDMLSDMVPGMKDALDTMNRANRGLFIGSKEFSNALKAAQNLSVLIENAPKPLAGDDNMKEQLRQTMAACKAYMDKKNPTGKDFKEILFKNDREKLRYEAIEKAFNYCRDGMSKIDLQNEAKALELKCALGREGKVEPVKSAEVFEKVGNEYSGLATINGTSAIRESDVGDIADKLRADINKSLERVLTIRGFEKNEARETFSKMVLLEIVKRGRGADDFGRPVAGDVERALAKQPEDVMRAFSNNGYIRSVTENLDADMLRQFVMTDRAKEVAEKMTQFAKKLYTPKEQPENPQVQNEKQNEQELKKNEPTASIQA